MQKSLRKLDYLLKFVNFNSAISKASGQHKPSGLDLMLLKYTIYIMLLKIYHIKIHHIIQLLLYLCYYQITACSVFPHIKKI